MYQPKVKDKYLGQLYFKAKREGKTMTQAINEAVAGYLYGEPEPPEEGRKRGKDVQRQANP